MAPLVDWCMLGRFVIEEGYMGGLLVILFK
jgi:hypothetical protein